MVSKADLQIQIDAINRASKELRAISGDLRGLDKAAGTSAGGVDKLNKSMAKSVFAGTFAASALAEAPRHISNFLKSASALDESLNKSRVVFGENAGAIEDWANTAAQNLGQSKQQALEAAGTFGNLFDALGLTGAQASKMSVDVVTLATDLSSFNNIGTDVALEKLRAGLVGEIEPLRTLGVNLTAATVEAKAMELGLASVGGQISESAKVQARYALILEQTKNAQGDFARTSDGFANRQRILKAEFTDLSASIAGAFLPAVTDGAGAAIKLAQGIEEVGGGLNKVVPVAGVFGSLTPGIVAFAGALTAVKIAEFAQGLVAAGGGLSRMRTFLNSTTGRLTLFAAGVVAADLALKEFSGQGIVDFFRTSDEESQGAAKGLDQYNRELEVLSSSRVDPSLFPEENASRFATQLKTVINDMQEAGRTFESEKGKFGTFFAGDQRVLELDFGPSAQDAKEELAEVRGEYAALIKLLPTFAAAHEDPIEALSLLSKELDGTSKEQFAARAAIGLLIVEYQDLAQSSESAAEQQIRQRIANTELVIGTEDQVTALQKLAGGLEDSTDASGNLTDQTVGLNAAFGTLDDTFNRINNLFSRPTIEELTLKAQIAETEALIAVYEEAGREVPADLQKWLDQLQATENKLSKTKDAAEADLELIAAKLSEAFGPNRQAEVDELLSRLEALPPNVLVDIVTSLEAGGVTAVEQYLAYLEARQVVVDIITNITEQVNRVFSNNGGGGEPPPPPPPGPRHPSGREYTDAEKRYIAEIARGRGEPSPFPGYVSGGIVNVPTTAMLGEGFRPEAVIPLTNPSRAMQLMEMTGLADMAQERNTSTAVNIYNPTFVLEGDASAALASLGVSLSG